MPIEFPKYPPRGYCPFEIEFKGQRGWVCATPHADSTDELCQGMTIETEEGLKTIEFNEYESYRERNSHMMDPPIYFSRDRIPVLFGTEEQAIKACWDHARHWWGGEPPSAWAIPLWRQQLPNGYRIFIEADPSRRMWLIKPDGTRTGEVSGTSLSMALEAYKPGAFQEVAEHTYNKQQVEERERIRAWTGDEAPRRWSFQYSDDGDFYPGLPQGHYAEMRIYLPFEMMEDVRAILRYCDGPSMAIHGHFRSWLDGAIREHAKIALGKLDEEDDGGS